MNLMTPPEIADGGYWCVLPVVADPELGGNTPGAIPSVNWCAWYGSTQVVIRTLEPVSGFFSSGDVGIVLAETGYGSKPYSRLGGQ